MITIDPQVLIAIIGVTVVVIFAIMGLVSKRFEVQVQRSAQDIRDLREEYRREIAARDVSLTIALKDLDNRLQVEFGNIVKNQDKDRELFQEAVDRIEQRVTDLIKSVSALVEFQRCSSKKE